MAARDTQRRSTPGCFKLLDFESKVQLLSKLDRSNPGLRITSLGAQEPKRRREK